MSKTLTHTQTHVRRKDTWGGDKEVGRGTSIRAGRRANTEEQAEGNRHRGVGPRTGQTEG